MERAEYEIMYRVEGDHWWYKGLRAMLRTAWQRHVPANGARVLDVGCGTGATLASLPPGTTCFGIDFSQDAIRFCRRRTLSQTAVASALSLPFSDDTFDVVISCDVVCHKSIENKLQPIQEMCRVMTPGGILILNLPAYAWLHSSHDLHVQTDHRFSRGEVISMLKECGLQPRYATYWNTVLFPLILPTRLWRSIRPLPASDLDHASGEGLTPLFSAALILERTLARFTRLPFGLSVLCVAEKGK